MPRGVDGAARLGGRVAEGGFLGRQGFGEGVAGKDFPLGGGHFDRPRGPEPAGGQGGGGLFLPGKALLQLRDRLLGQRKGPQHDGPAVLLRQKGGQFREKGAVLPKEDLVFAFDFLTDLVHPVHIEISFQKAPGTRGSGGFGIVWGIFWRSVNGSTRRRS